MSGPPYLINTVRRHDTTLSWQGLFRGVGSPAQNVSPSSFAPVAIGAKTDGADTNGTGNSDNGRRSASGADKTTTKGGNPKPE